MAANADKNPVLAFIKTLVDGAEKTCDLRTTATNDKESFPDLMRYLDKLKNAVDFVTEKGGTYRFYPKGVYRSITYDGGIATDLIPNESKNSFTVVTWMYVKNQWARAERLEDIGAYDLLIQLGQNKGIALGVPLALRRDISRSAVHRRVVCGITLDQVVKSGPK